MIEELDPELFIYELYDSGGPLVDPNDQAKYAIGWCDAGRLQVRPRPGLYALMLEYPDGDRIWFHIEPKMLGLLEKRRERINNYEARCKEGRL